MLLINWIYSLYREGERELNRDRRKQRQIAKKHGNCFVVSSNVITNIFNKFYYAYNLFLLYFILLISYLFYAILFNKVINNLKTVKPFNPHVNLHFSWGRKPPHHATMNERIMFIMNSTLSHKCFLLIMLARLHLHRT